MIPALVRPLFLLLLTIITFASPTWAEEPCPPKPETWPSVNTPIPGMWWTPFTPRFHGETFRLRCNSDSSAPDMGALICKDGKWEVYGMGPYDPNNLSQRFWVNLYGRYGCGPSGGHGHGIDAYVYPAEDYELVTGKPLIFGSIEHIDTWYHPSLYKWIEFEARKKEGPPPLCPNRVCDPGEDSKTCPQDCSGVEQKPVEPANPINSICNNICNELDRICNEDGNLIGGRCPSDCDPCTSTTKPPDPPETQPANAISCKPFTTPLAETIRSLEAELETLSKIPTLPDYLAVLYREEKARALAGKLGICTRYNRSVPQLCAMYLCPADLVRVVCRRSNFN